MKIQASDERYDDQACKRHVGSSAGMRTLLVGQYLAIVLTCCVACAQGKSPSPIQPTSPTQPSLFGSVHDMESQGLVSSRVEIAEGSQAGAFVITGSDGSFEIPGPFSGAIILRASKDGYVPSTQQIQVPNRGMVFRLVTLPDLAGNYRITFVAENCNSQWPMLPTEYGTRTYAARMEQNGTDLALEVVRNGLPYLFGPDYPNPRLRGQIQQDGAVKLTGYYAHNESWEAVYEQVTPNNLLSITVDEMTLAVSPEGLSGTFTGAFVLYDWSGAGWTNASSGCLSKSHSAMLSH